MRRGREWLALVVAACSLTHCGRLSIHPEGQVGLGPVSGTISPEISTAGNRLITIRESQFNPPELVVPPGSRVTWSNQDDIVHNVTILSTSRRGADIKPRGTFAYTFSSPGGHEYVCAQHSNMRGIVIVE